ncbi:hypothetical protein [Rubinisphaera brasiliensis]|uniref:Uncharacterized protein n=1 Tax=Rubinisphaera brasiliensis (strain ATCC 49424 / DSM 5305 / JCM 21570 / IAM 15109 / NBRC 103401 / IFAM 1448) TaxID=756272 RepID=F0SHQ2_RUBBR|nr:hypothetical protein [Rubinisphaera brasiliensis]ADY59532.1 hypothetical protein Plabr_1923 [Rubinisphaera brasiliensis DSM 5305]
MQRLIVSLVVCGVLILSQSLPAQESTSKPEKAEATAPKHEFTSVDDVLSEGTFQVDVLELVVPEEAEQIARKLKEFAQEHPVWFATQAALRKPGEPIPYDKRMGITEEEYKIFNDSPKLVKARKTRTATLRIHKFGSSYVFDGDRDLPSLTSVTIDADGKFVRTPIGDFKRRTEHKTSADTPLGAWTGRTWSSLDGDLNTLEVTDAKLTLGVRAESGHTLILYEIKGFSPKGKFRLSRMLAFDPNQE